VLFDVLLKKMKTLIKVILISLSPLCNANEKAIESAKAHLEGSFGADYRTLDATYAPKVTLMPGHEFLKEEYGLAGAGGRAEGADVEADQLIKAMETAAAKQPARPADRVKALLDTLKYEVVKVAEGPVAIAPSDPVGTPDGKLHFQVKKGDVLLKVSPPKGDCLLLHLRKIDGIYRIVSEYLD
jgi:hypothetical protein